MAWKKVTAVISLLDILLAVLGVLTGYYCDKKCGSVCLCFALLYLLPAVLVSVKIPKEHLLLSDHKAVFATYLFR
jgi:hypothetical protein